VGFGLVAAAINGASVSAELGTALSSASTREESVDELVAAAINGAGASVEVAIIILILDGACVTGEALDGACTAGGSARNSEEAVDGLVTATIIIFILDGP